MDIYVYFNPISRLILQFLLLLILASSCLNTSSTVESCMEEDRQALLNFKQDLIDPSGRLSSWVGHQCCEWRGISCNNHTGRIVRLDLRNPYPYPPFSEFDDYSWNYTKFNESCLRGKLHPSLLGLKHLSYLDLSQNCFHGSHIPNFIGDLTSLRYLNLSNVLFSGSFVGEIPPSLGNLSNLNYLDLSTDYIGDIVYYSKSLNWLSHLSSLKYLNLRGANLNNTGVSWLHAVNMLPSLLELRSSNCQIDGNQVPLSLPTINFTSLLVLDMSNNHINSSFPKWLVNLTSLTKLDLGDNPFLRPSLEEFVRLKALEYLDLRRIRLTGQLLPFGNLCKLKSLDLSNNEIHGGIQEFLSGFSNCSSNRMESLGLSYCGMKGELPSSLGKLKSLQLLDLSANYFRGSIPESIFNNLSSSLETLSLDFNLFNGSIPESLGQLSQLVRLDLYNSWEGSLREAHFINLTRLKHLRLATDRPVPIIFNLTDYEWIPPFKLQLLSMDNCRVGPGFPVWLQSQTELSSVQVSNAGISGAIPEEWMSNISSQIESLDLSYNQISGKLPLQFNFPDLEYIYFGHNQFYGTIPSSICSIQSLSSLALNNNQLFREFPKEWSLWSYIFFVDVSNNNLTGEIPRSMGIPSSLYILKMNNNQLSGEIPSALQNCSNLLRLFLGGNNFTGSIPSWIGSKVSGFTVLQLRSNSLSGHIPHQLCSLPHLQFLDLGHNRFSGTIPKCLNNLTALVSGPNIWVFFGENTSNEHEEITATTKGRESEYFFSQVWLLTIIDLSSNDLEGEIPEEISSLLSLGTLNLSMNQLSGSIPSKIGNLYRLETLDLSQNRLSGHIPQSLSNMTFLSHLNLSHNKLTGRIPSGNQLQTLVDPSIYEGNSLCGFPLPKCPEDEDNMHEPDVQEKKDHGDDEEKLGFYTSAVLGFIIGFWSVCGTLILKKSWSAPGCAVHPSISAVHFEKVKSPRQMDGGDGRLLVGAGTIHWQRKDHIEERKSFQPTPSTGSTEVAKKVGEGQRWVNSGLGVEEGKAELRLGSSNDVGGSIVCGGNGGLGLGLCLC
ncbi:hypothetical protein ACLB2K_027542 [Fragaria x ananassa]